MVREVAGQFVTWQKKQGYISLVEEELYQYGYELFFSLLFNIIIAIVVAVVFSSYWEVTAFYVTYSAMRIYAGGFHARSYEKCMVMSGAILVLVCILIGKIPPQCYFAFAAFQMTLAVPIIWRIAPVEDHNKPLDCKEIAVYRKRARCVLALVVLAAVLFFLLQIPKIGYIISLSCFLLCITLAMGVLKNRH